MSAAVCILLLLLLLLPSSLQFLPPVPPRLAFLPLPASSNLFDFLSEKSAEGFTQLTTLAGALSRGNLTAGIAEVKAYVSQENKIFAAKLKSMFPAPLLESFKTSFGDGKLRTASDVAAACTEMRALLVSADVGSGASDAILASVAATLNGQLTEVQTLTYDDILAAMKFVLVNTLSPPSNASQTTGTLPVYLLMGANGMGKTTTIGKLAHRLQQSAAALDPTAPQFKVLVAAADTYRAGAVAQLKVWAERAKADIVTPTDVVVKMGKEATAEAVAAVKPSTVVYSALDRAVAEKYDALLIDTSGRLSTNIALTMELSKLHDIIEKRLGVPPTETVLVLDASLGSSALSSAITWSKALPITAVALTKLEGTSCGGAAVSVAQEMGIPVKLVGVGEGLEDLKDFDAGVFVDGLLGIGDKERDKVGEKVDALIRQAQAAKS